MSVFKLPIHFFLAGASLLCGSALARGPAFKPERVPGSSQLVLREIRVIHLPPEPSEALFAAVEDLVGLWPGELEKAEVGDGPGKESLILMRVKPREPEAFTGGGFTLSRERTKVYLKADSDEGLLNGIYAICQDLLGIRWYWPGDLGLEQVRGADATFPDRIWRDRPAFVERRLGNPTTDFGRRNRLNRKFSFNHNLARIFTQEVFDEHPEAFAQMNGVRGRPRGSWKYDPQPDFTEAKTAELAAEAAARYFLENPEATSFSLSINDNSLYDEGPETEAVLRGLNPQWEDGRARSPGKPQSRGEVEFFRGRPNYTDLVFGFMNQVARRLDERATSKSYLTALAYYTTEQSPSFSIHPRVMPVLTSDRAQWHDCKYRKEDKALIKRWVESGAERIATWDYYYGAPYPYPRHFNEWVGKSLRYLHKSGVDVFYSSIPSVWGLDGPKAWLASQLLWDPGQDVQVLLNEYYTNFFGPAAEPIREFFEMAEQTRNEREGEANWIKFFKDEAGIELFDEVTLREMRGCITRAEQAVRRVGACSTPHTDAPRGVPWTPGAGSGLPVPVWPIHAKLSPNRYAERVRIVSEAFAYTESYAIYHQSRVAMVGTALTALNPDGHDVPGPMELQEAIGQYQEARRAFRAMSGKIVEAPLHQRFSSFNRQIQTEPLPLALAAKTESETRPRQLVRNPQLKHSGAEFRNFIGPEIPVIENWTIQYRCSDGLRVAAADPATSSGLRVENADIVTLEQTLPVVAERQYLLEIESSWQVSPDNRTRIQLNWKSITGDNLRTEIVLRLPNGDSSGRKRLKFLLESPVNAYDLKLGIVTNRQYDGDFLEIHQVEVRLTLPSLEPITKSKSDVESLRVVAN